MSKRKARPNRFKARPLKVEVEERDDPPTRAERADAKERERKAIARLMPLDLPPIDISRP